MCARDGLVVCVCLCVVCGGGVCLQRRLPLPARVGNCVAKHQRVSGGVLQRRRRSSVLPLHRRVLRCRQWRCEFDLQRRVFAGLHVHWRCDLAAAVALSSWTVQPGWRSDVLTVFARVRNTLGQPCTVIL